MSATVWTQNYGAWPGSKFRRGPRFNRPSSTAASQCHTSRVYGENASETKEG
jgi:hypothetical protein